MSAMREIMVYDRPYVPVPLALITSRLLKVTPMTLTAAPVLPRRLPRTARSRPRPSELHMAQPSISEQVRRLEAELGVRALPARRPRADADRGGPHAAPARRAHARRGRGGARVGGRRARAARRDGDLRHVGHRALLPRRRLRRRVPPPPPERARARGRPELLGGRRGGARGRARGGDGRAADRRPRARRAADHARRDRLRLRPTPSARARIRSPSRRSRRGR